MVYTKTSIFLLFFIIGTSVFPNDSSIGLASAKPQNSLYTWNQLPLHDIIDHSKRLASQPPRNNRGPIVSYASITNSEDNTIVNENIRGSVTFDTSSP
ncbi:GSCOCT00014217001.2-RA-CDS [Cotesia congregata]|uniref:Cc_bv5.4_23.3 n=2 Tax=root TaxID=1 RepID=S6D2T2_COTCN|nr:unnamed protein product [Bracoviriform congregatae]CAD6243344.1 GSCOCT00014217001.2-RA-CDS [Cotesia congregata]CAG17483.1 unnamed protein product [Bracoviriform congregatae]CAG5092343.1 cc_bv5.4_23.3 [Cotesia congregata]CCQ71093.1 hypothetical protein BV5-4 [Cotesia congregata]